MIRHWRKGGPMFCFLINVDDGREDEGPAGRVDVVPSDLFRAYRIFEARIYFSR